jgi:hypothetical protein
MGGSGASRGSLGGTSDGEGSPSHENNSNNLCALLTSGPAAPVLPRLPALLTMISRDGIHGGTVKEARSLGPSFFFPLLAGLTSSPRRLQRQKEARSTGGRRPGFSRFYALTLCSRQTVVACRASGVGSPNERQRLLEKRLNQRRDLMNKRPGWAEPSWHEIARQ